MPTTQPEPELELPLDSQPIGHIEEPLGSVQTLVQPESEPNGAVGAVPPTWQKPLELGHRKNYPLVAPPRTIQLD